MFEKLIAVLAPHSCIVCSDEGSILCLLCANDTITPVPSRCYRCFAITADSAVCVKCRPNTALRHVWVRTDYANIARELVYRLKFDRAQAAAKEIARMLDEAIPYLPADTIITYIPTASGRVRVRGYDQSKLIAAYLARQRGLPCRSLLIRLGQTRQVRSKRAQRIAQAQYNYQAKAQFVLPKTVLLIDDITTTGASLEAAARILKQSGIKHVNAAVFAQKH